MSGLPQSLTLPNLITIARFLLAPVIVLAMIDGNMRLAFFLFIAAGVSDAVDGIIARQFGQVSELGAYLDPIADKLLLVSVFVMLAILGAIPDWLVVLVVSRDVMIVGAVLLSDVLGKPVTVRPLLVSKATTFAQIVLAIAALGGLAGFGWLAAHAFWLVPAAAVLTGASAAAYLVTWLRHMATGDQA
jgi:cardiolipin synthase